MTSRHRVFTVASMLVVTLGLCRSQPLAGQAPAGAQADLDISVHVRRLSARVAVVSLGDQAWSNLTVALATAKGLVVIDTQGSRSAARLVKAAIERTFGRSDFAYVINTHQHYDHTNGNQIYRGVTIVAHEECATGMRADAVLVPETLARLERAVAGFDQELKTLDARSEKAKASREYAALLGAVVRETRNGPMPALPTMTFNDRLTLDLGNVSVRLCSLPAGHTAGDIVVHVPEESLLCVGDTIAEGWLPVLEARAAPDPDDFLPKWRSLLAGAAGTRHVIMGHGFAPSAGGPNAPGVSIDTLAWRYAYLKALWDGLARARRDGRSLDEVKAEWAFDRAFPHLKDKRREITARDGKPADAHVQNIDVMWRALDARNR